MGCCIRKSDDKVITLKLDNLNLNIINPIKNSNSVNEENDLDFNTFFSNKKTSENENIIVASKKHSSKNFIPYRQMSQNLKEIKEQLNKENEEMTNKIENESLITLPKLDLYCICSKNQENFTIIITPNSINNIIKKCDKFIFGRLDRSIKNDYNFNDESIGVRQFEIMFDKLNHKYYIVDSRCGTGLFVKIKNKIVIKQDMIVSFCATHMVLQLDENNKKFIKIKFLQGPYASREFVFYSNIKDVIRIGRSRNAEILYKDDSVSRIQCSIVYENNNTWVLYDGVPETINKNSTNGLWLLANEKIEMDNNMLLKTGNLSISVNLTY